MFSLDILSILAMYLNYFFYDDHATRFLAKVSPQDFSHFPDLYNIVQDMGNTHSYLLDENCFDQFSVIYEGGGKTAIYLNSVPEPTVVEERKVSETGFKARTKS